MWGFVFLIKADENSWPMYCGPSYWRGHPAVLYSYTETNATTELDYKQHYITYMTSLPVYTVIMPSSSKTNTKYTQKNNILLKIKCLTDFGTIVWHEDNLKLCT
jgi:hypothetical protein